MYQTFGAAKADATLNFHVDEKGTVENVYSRNLSFR